MAKAPSGACGILILCVKNACMAFFPRYLQPKSVLLERLLLPGLDTAVYHKPHLLVYLYVIIPPLCTVVCNNPVSLFIYT